jgi:hypothetical protein
MARTLTEEAPPVRKGILIVAGAAIGAALIGFILMNFVLKGGSGTAPTQPLPTSAVNPALGGTSPLSTATPVPVSNEVTPGGRDPFGNAVGIAPIATPAPVVAPAAQAPAPAAKTAVLASDQVNQHFSLTVVKVSGNSADLKFNGKAISGVHPGDKLPSGVQVQNVGDGCASFNQGGQVFSVCEGQTVQR